MGNVFLFSRYFFELPEFRSSRYLTNLCQCHSPEEFKHVGRMCYQTEGAKIHHMAETQTIQDQT